jgi:hypothetical protein
MTYFVFDGKKPIANGQPTASLAPDFSVTFSPNFKTVKGHTYTVIVNANEANGHNESRTAVVTAV